MSIPPPTPPPETLIFRGRLSEDDCVDLHRAHFRTVLRPSVQWFVRAVAAGLAALFIPFLIERGPNVGAVLYLLACLYIAFLHLPARDRQIRRHYRRHEDDYLESEVRLTPQRVAIFNDAENTDFDWRRVKLVAQCAAGVLFCNQAHQAMFWLPQRLFDGDPTLRERVLELARSCGVPVRRV